MPFPVRNRRVNHWMITGRKPAITCFYNTINIIEITTVGAGSYSKPINLYAIEVIGIGGGGGGGSGRNATAVSNRYGGGGGSRGVISRDIIPASALAPSENYYVGAGGVGGAAQLADPANGNSGTDGEDTTFGSFIIARRGVGGNLGATSNAAGGAAPTGYFPLSFMNSIIATAGGNGSNGTGTNASWTGAVTSSNFVLYSAAGGGGVNSSDVHQAGGVGGRSRLNHGGTGVSVPGGLAGGGDAGAALDNAWTNLSISGALTFGIGYGNSGSGGGAANLASGLPGGAGANGGLYGGAGGGGGGAGGPGSGKGGDGAQGCLIIVEYLQ